ncbi:MAG: ankyrin repeat domain-containing protein [Planctomycetaceae bacterium]
MKNTLITLAPCLVLFLTASHVIAVESNIADAAERADWTSLTMMLAKGADVKAAQTDGMTALHWAAWHDNAEANALLTKHGADVNVANKYGVTPLSIACTNGNAAIIRQLVNAGADVNVAQPGGETVLMTAARTGRLETVNVLLQYKADVDAKEQGGQTAIMWAAAEGHANVVDTLIKAGAEFQTPLKSGFNALFFAVREGRQSVVDVLLTAGADVNAVMTPAAKGPRVPRHGTSPLLLAVENGHFELAAHLLARGADANDQRSGFTALHVLSWVRKPNLGDDIDGEPPPIGSGNMTSLQLVRELVKNGADVNIRLEAGRSGRGRLNQKEATPFLLAADTADVPYMKLLLELGADPTIPNVDHCPPLLAAAGIGTIAPGEEAGNEDEAIAAVELLLKLGADINAIDDNGETAMHGAAYGSLPKMVRYLAEHGADISLWNAKNKYNWTPLLIAEGYRQGNFKPSAETIQALREVMLKAGVKPPSPTDPRPPRNNDQYAPPKKPAAPPSKKS